MRHCLLVFALILAGCGDDRPPAPTAEENARLNEAEAMLNEMADEEPPIPEPEAGRR